jgi:hypothetical protein
MFRWSEFLMYFSSTSQIRIRIRIRIRNQGQSRIRIRIRKKKKFSFRIHNTDHVTVTQILTLFSHFNPHPLPPIRRCIIFGFTVHLINWFKYDPASPPSAATTDASTPWSSAATAGFLFPGAMTGTYSIWLEGGRVDPWLVLPVWLLLFYLSYYKILEISFFSFIGCMARSVYLRTWPTGSKPPAWPLWDIETERKSQY